MEKSVVFSEEGGDLVASLLGEIDHHIAKEQREAIDSMLFRKKPDVLVLDFSGVKFMDSSGIGLIIGRIDVAEAVGCSIRIRGLSDLQKKLVRLSGIEKMRNLTVERGGV